MEKNAIIQFMRQSICSKMKRNFFPKTAFYGFLHVNILVLELKHSLRYKRVTSMHLVALKSRDAHFKKRVTWKDTR